MTVTEERIVVLQTPAFGGNVRRVGEDVAHGDRVLHAGSRLTPARVSLAASLGLASLPVARRTVVANDRTGSRP